MDAAAGAEEEDEFFGDQSCDDDFGNREADAKRLTVSNAMLSMTGGYFNGVVRGGGPRYRHGSISYETSWGHSGVPTTNIYLWGQFRIFFGIMTKNIFW